MYMLSSREFLIIRILFHTQAHRYPMSLFQAFLHSVRDCLVFFRCRPSRKKVVCVNKLLSGLSQAFPPFFVSLATIRWRFDLDIPSLCWKVPVFLAMRGNGSSGTTGTFDRFKRSRVLLPLTGEAGGFSGF